MHGVLRRGKILIWAIKPKLTLQMARTKNPGGRPSPAGPRPKRFKTTAGLKRKEPSSSVPPSSEATETAEPNPTETPPPPPPQFRTEVPNVPFRWDRFRFRTKSKQQRFIEIGARPILEERRLAFKAREYRRILAEVERRKWDKLVEPEGKFNEEIIKEFYANAMPVKLSMPGGRRPIRQSYVRGVLVSYEPRNIDAYLETGYLPEEQPCEYQRRVNMKKVKLEEMEHVLCLHGRGFTLGKSGRPIKLVRRDMNTMARIWQSFVLSNIISLTHISDINVARAKLLFCIMTGYVVDVATIISYEIDNMVRSQPSLNTGQARPLGFPGLITGLLKMKGVPIPLLPLKTLKPPINDTYIKYFCYNPLEDMQGPQPRRENVPGSHLTSREYNSIMLQHIMQQQTFNHIGLMKLNESLQKFVQQHHEDFDNPFVLPYQFEELKQWPGSRPTFPERHREVDPEMKDNEDEEETANEGEAAAESEHDVEKQVGGTEDEGDGEDGSDENNDESEEDPSENEEVEKEVEAEFLRQEREEKQKTEASTSKRRYSQRLKSGVKGSISKELEMVEVSSESSTDSDQQQAEPVSPASP